MSLAAPALALFLALIPARSPDPGADRETALPGMTGPVEKDYRFPVSAERRDALIRIRAVGDVMLGSDHEDDLPDQDLLTAMGPVLRQADLTLANLEGPFTNATACRKRPGPDGETYAFRTPPRLARRLLAAGIDLASLANNHAHDFGEAGRRQTEETLDALGIGWSGRPGTYAARTVRGTRVAMAAFAPYAHGNNLLDTARAGDFIADLAARHDILIVSMHAGAEGDEALRTPDGPEAHQGERRGDVRAFARMAVDRGADLVVGHGPHVVRGLEVYKGRLIAYSLGNFATAGQIRRWGRAGAGAVLSAALTRDGGLAQARIIPTRQSAQGVPAPDPDQTALRLMRALTARDFPHTGPGLDPSGLVRPERPAGVLALAQADLKLLDPVRAKAPEPAPATAASRPPAAMASRTRTRPTAPVRATAQAIKTAPVKTQAQAPKTPGKTAAAPGKALTAAPSKALAQAPKTAPAVTSAAAAAPGPAPGKKAPAPLSVLAARTPARPGS